MRPTLAPQNVGHGQHDVREEEKQNDGNDSLLVVGEDGRGQGDGETRMPRRRGKGQGAAVAGIGPAEEMADQQAEQDDGRQ